MEYAVEIINARFADEASFDFRVKKGDLSLIIDPNERWSAGILLSIAGISFLKSGHLKIFGRENPTERRRIGYLPQELRINSNQTVKQLIEDWSKALNLADPRASSEEALSLVDLHTVAELTVNDLPGEQKDWLLLAGALLASPDLLLINHRLRFMDYRNKQKLIRLLDNLRRAWGVTVILALSSTDELLDLADQIYLVKGRRLLELDPQELASKSKSFIEVEVREPDLATVVLESAGLKYRVLANQRLEIESAEPWKVNQLLVEGGIRLISSSPVKNELKDLLEDLLEGGEHGIL